MDNEPQFGPLIGGPPQRTPLASFELGEQVQARSWWRRRRAWWRRRRLRADAGYAFASRR
jgi:hypothetical protein